MKYKISRIMSVLMIAMLILGVFTACSSSEKGDNVEFGGYTGGHYTDSYDVMSDEGFVSDDSLANGSSSNSVEESAKADTESVTNGRKIIEKIFYSVQTKNFDKLTTSLEQKVSSLGGYIESSDVYGNTYESFSYRNASYVFRIPSNKVDEFMTFIGENSTVTNKTINTEDVTLQYVDTESRIKALEIERDSLEELLKNAKTTSDIIKIRDMLTDVIYEIERNKTQLRTYDNLIDYTTVTVDVNEVEQTDIVHKQTTFERIGTDFVDSCLAVWNFLVEIFVFIVGSLPVILFVALILLVIFLVVRKFVKKASKKQRKPFESPVVKKPETSLTDEDKTDE